MEEIDQTVRSALHFVPVEQVDEVLAAALAYPITANDSGHVPALPLEDSRRPACRCGASAVR